MPIAAVRLRRMPELKKLSYARQFVSGARRKPCLQKDFDEATHERVAQSTERGNHPRETNEPQSALCACRGGVFSESHGKDFCLCKKICVNPSHYHDILFRKQRFEVCGEVVVRDEDVDVLNVRKGIRHDLADLGAVQHHVRRLCLGAREL